MRGLELSEKYYEETAAEILKRDFADIYGYLAAGIAGAGSECLGYDDDVSSDHDFEPGFMIFLPGEDLVDRKKEFLLERMYAKLPKEFVGYKRSLVSPTGGARHGVIRISDFVAEKTGSKDGDLTPEQWLSLPEQSLLELCCGKIFFDNLGIISGIRERMRYYPEDIRKKKLASNLLLAAQAGQYNYERCIKHGEYGAAQLAAFEFTKAAMRVIFLLNRRYMPYYKWQLRALGELERLSIERPLFEYLISTSNDEGMHEEKYDVIESICADIIDALRDDGITDAICSDLEKHAYSVNDKIEDTYIRNMNIFAGV